MTDARIVRSRANLRQALLEMLESRPFEQVTIRDLAAASGVGYTTFFRHYPSKEALLGDVAVREVGQLHAMTLPVYDALDSAAACLALCTYVDQHRSLWTALLAGAPGYVREEMLRLGREAVAVRTRSWLPQDLGVVLGVAVIVELLGWWLQQPEPPPAAQIAEILDRVAISPAQAPAGATPPTSASPDRIA